MSIKKMNKMMKHELLLAEQSKSFVSNMTEAELPPNRHIRYLHATKSGDGLNNKIKFFMKIKHIQIFILLILSVLSCKQTHKNADNTSIKTSENIYSDSVKIYDMITVSLNIDMLQQYLIHQKIYNQEFIAIDRTGLPYFFEDFTHNKIVFPVKFFTKQELYQNNIKAYVSFENINIRNDNIRTLLLYDIEGVRIDVQCSIDSFTLKLDNYHLWER